MSSTEARPSTHPASATTSKEVMLTLEPVHIYTDPNVPTATSSNPTSATSTLSLFERERKLADITAEGTNIFTPRKAASAQLSDDVHRLWAERGDFSRFRTSDLVKRKRSLSSSSPSSPSFSDEDEDEELGMRQRKQQQEEEQEGRKAGTGEKRIGGTIEKSQFVHLRNTVLSNLDLAHFNSIHAHQLLGMLIKQYRSTTSTAVAGGRMGSPAPSISGQSNRSNPPTLKTAPLGIFSHLSSANRENNREEEFVLDPLAIALSRTSLNSSTVATRRKLSSVEEGNADNDEDEEDEYAQDPTSAGYGLRQAKKEMESGVGYKENRLREFKVVLETKRKAIRNAAELLSSAAEELKSSHGPNRERWRALIGLHGRGWGLTPGRPLLDVERFGVTPADEDEEEQGSGATTTIEGEGESEEKKGEGKRIEEKGGGGKKSNKKEESGKGVAAGLQGFGTPIVTSEGKIKEEGARDAWLGFGLPEAPIELKRRSIAYWADLPTTSTSTTVEDVKQKLVFPDRLRRRLRVRFVLWPSTMSSSGERMEWSSDAPRQKGKEEEEEEGEGKPVIVGQVLDDELQAASREATDELVFGDVVAQARQLPPTFGVRLTSSSVRIVLTKRLDLIVELVPITASSEEKGGDGKEVRYAPHAKLLLAFLRMGPLRKYQAFVTATMLGRGGDASARVASIKAVALAVPKKSSSSGSGGKGGDGKNEGVKGKGIAAGGKATSTALSKLDTLGPVVVGLHYWSFVHRLGSLLQDLQKSAASKGDKVLVQLVPITPSNATTAASSLERLSDLTGLLGRMVDATPSNPHPHLYTKTQGTKVKAGGENHQGMHSIYDQQSASQEGKRSGMEALRGYAKVFVEERLVCSLSFAQPSLLSVQFEAAQKAQGKKGVRLTNKPLTVDLDTLGSLLSPQLGQYT